MIILTSSIATVAGDIFKNYLSEKNYTSVLFIDTAAELEIGKVVGDDDWLLADLQSLIDLGYQVDRYTVTNQSVKEVTAKIDGYDVLYMCGGNTLYLLQQLQKTGAFNLIVEKVKAGKPYIGTSAGSIIAGPKIPAYLEGEEGIQLDDYSGFNFLNTIIVPHWGSRYFKTTYLEKGMIAAYQTTEPPFLLLNDNQYISVDGAKIEVVTTLEPSETSAIGGREVQ